MSETYRYTLVRWILTTGAMKKGSLFFIMLNPSTADETQDDPTIRRCMTFAQTAGYTEMRVLNLFAFRATKPEDLLETPAPIGPENDTHLVSIPRDALVVVSWGAIDRRLRRRIPRVLELLGKERRLWCLGTTKDGSPRHPLYVKGSQHFEPWELQK